MQAGGDVDDREIVVGVGVDAGIESVINGVSDDCCKLLLEMEPVQVPVLIRVDCELKTRADEGTKGSSLSHAKRGPMRRPKDL